MANASPAAFKLTAYPNWEVIMVDFIKSDCAVHPLASRTNTIAVDVEDPLGAPTASVSPEADNATLRPNLLTVRSPVSALWMERCRIHEPLPGGAM
jgi:hypothetical protein